MIAVAKNGNDQYIANYAAHGYTVVPDLLSRNDLHYARALVDALVARYRLGISAALSDGVSIGDITAQKPSRNPDVDAGRWQREPFIIGDLVSHDRGFGRLISKRSIWECAAALLDAPFNEIVFHFSNLTRKPARVGPAIGWHRDYINTYFASADRRTIRLLLPLQSMSETNGGTAVLPGSHHSNTSIDDLTHAICPVVAAGSALAIHAQILHGGAPNRSDEERDVLVMQFGLRSSALSYQAHESMSMCGFEEFAK